MTITPQQSISIIVENFPDFAPQLEKFNSLWMLEEERPYGLEIGEFGDYVYDLLYRGYYAQMVKVSDVVEQMFAFGDKAVKWAFQYMFIESIYHKIDDFMVGRLDGLLRPLSQKALHEIYQQPVLG